jgi:hypothetical protein
MSWPKIPAWGVRWGLIALCVVAVLFYLRFAPDSLKPWAGRGKTPSPSEAPVPKPVEKIKRVVVPGPGRVQVIEKIKYIEKMPDSLPSATASNPAAQVIASAEIPPHTGKTIATAILETGQDNVGRGRIEYHQIPPPFFQIKKEFGLRAGMGTGGLILAEAYARPMRIGPVDIEARGYAKRTNADGADFGGAVLLDYRF